MPLDHRVVWRKRQTVDHNVKGSIWHLVPSVGMPHSPSLEHS